MFTGGNPFETDTTFTEQTTPRIRITEINETNVVLAVEAVNAQGYPVVTFHRACLRVGDCLTLSNMTLDITIKEK